MNRMSFRSLVLLLSLAFSHALIQAQPVLQTGVGEMPDAWIDQATGHLVKKILHEKNNLQGDFKSFYFHNNPFMGNLMVFYGTVSKDNDKAVGSKGAANADGDTRLYSRQLYSYNFTNGKVLPLTRQTGLMEGEIVSKVNQEAYYQIKDTVYAVQVATGKSRVVFVFPNDFKGSVTTVNADGTLLGGARASEQEREIFKQYPGKHDYFNRIYEAKLPRTLFTISLKTGKLEKIFSDSAWLNHVQFSPTDPDLLMFCHEGPWHKVDRIWTINVKGHQKPRLIHARSIEGEIAGHEWFSSDGKYIWFDLQMPRGKKFMVGGVNLATHQETRYNLTRDEWSVHYSSSWDQQYFAGDGGGPHSVASAKDGQWMYLFTPKGDKFISEKLVDMRHHDYKLEPNLHFSPDGKWLIFRANFEGHSDIYAVRIKKGPLRNE